MLWKNEKKLKETTVPNFWWAAAWLTRLSTDVSGSIMLDMVEKLSLSLMVEITLMLVMLAIFNPHFRSDFQTEESFEFH